MLRGIPVNGPSEGEAFIAPPGLALEPEPPTRKRNESPFARAWLAPFEPGPPGVTGLRMISPDDVVPSAVGADAGNAAPPSSFAFAFAFEARGGWEESSPAPSPAPARRAMLVAAAVSVARMSLRKEDSTSRAFSSLRSTNESSGREADGCEG